MLKGFPQGRIYLKAGVRSFVNYPFQNMICKNHAKTEGCGQLLNTDVI
jgi:hypothetical protein